MTFTQLEKKLLAMSSQVHARAGWETFIIRLSKKLKKCRKDTETSSPFYAKSYRRIPTQKWDKILKAWLIRKLLTNKFNNLTPTLAWRPIKLTTVCSNMPTNFEKRSRKTPGRPYARQWSRKNSWTPLWWRGKCNLKRKSAISSCLAVTLTS